MMAMMIMMIQVLTKLFAERYDHYGFWIHFLGQLQLELGMFRLSCSRSWNQYTRSTERLAFKIVEANIRAANEHLALSNMKYFLGWVMLCPDHCKARFDQYHLILEGETMAELEEYAIQCQGHGMLWSFKGW